MHPIDRAIREATGRLPPEEPAEPADEPAAHVAGSFDGGARQSPPLPNAGLSDEVLRAARNHMRMTRGVLFALSLAKSMSSTHHHKPQENTMTNEHDHPEQRSVDEMMRLGEGYGVIPEELRNRGYDKLDFEPGEGGLGQPAPTGSGEMQPFLAGVAAGADPKELAKELLGSKAKRGRGR